MDEASSTTGRFTLDMRAPLEVGVSVRDLDAMAAFYETVIGLTRMTSVELGPETAQRAGFNEAGFDMVRMQTPYGERIKLLCPRDGHSETERPRWFLGRPGVAYLTFLVGDLRGTLARLAAHGVELVSGAEPIQTRPGTLIAFARDIEGNALEFVEYADLRAYRPDLFPA
jgi:catechol 2,3-dioxygenase-like lactoylglutathione lyase family enzyme